MLTHTFSLQHNSNSLLAITSPIPQTQLDNALIDLAADQNYVATDATCPAPINPQGNPTAGCYSAAANSASSINWTTQLTYATSGNLGTITDPTRSFPTSSGQQQNEVYQNEGGQIKVTSTTVASDGSRVEDCTAAYLEGPAGGIPNGTITSQLVTSPQSYPSSSSYPSGGTPNLMAQVAVYESLGAYAQFLEPPQPPKNVDLYNLYANSHGAIAPKWPIESQKPGGISDGGSHIGLTQVMTDANQTADPNTWNWVTNATDGVNLFSGTPPAEYNDNKNKIEHASTYETEIIAMGYTPKLPHLNAQQLENMALVLYGPYAAMPLTMQYYIPVCSPPGKVVKTFTCKGGSWTWQPNSGSTGNPKGVMYANAVRAETVPQ